MPNAHVDTILAHFARFIEGGANRQLYAVLDGARNDRLYPTIQDNGIANRCLYTGHELIYMGRMPQVLASVAPYVVKLKTKGDPFARWLLRDGWRDNWGIFLVSKAPLDELLRHFRRYVMVRNEQGQSVYFRFYDPRVFRPYMPTCSPEEAEMIFGPVERFYVEGESDNTLQEFSLVKGSVVRRVMALGPRVPAADAVP